jgi:uncharacterized protein (DUF2235 family)
MTIWWHPGDASMSKNIILLSDGTGNSAAKVFKTNVWRLFQILDLRDPTSQIAYYDDGVGTSSFKAFAILGGVFGFGLKRNVIDIYSFCCRNYKAGDRIYCFGFSRGAFTIRIVAGMIARQGLVRYRDNEADLARFAADAYRLYRRRFTGGILKFLPFLRNIRDFAIRKWRQLWRQSVSAPAPTSVESIHFVGLWDTVDAYGGPIEEMTRAIDYWVWPLSMPDRFMSAKVHKACHALALEDERDAFRPVIWDERYVRSVAEVAGRDKKDWLFDINYDPRSEAAKSAEPAPHLRTDLAPIDRRRISQVWFTGVHSDVGGGYPQDGLSYVTLDWMLDRAKAYGLRYFDKQRDLLIDPQINPADKLNDSRKGLAGYYRYKPRNILETYSAPPYKPSFSSDVRQIWRLIVNDFRRLLGKTPDPDPQTEILADLHPTMRAPEGEATDVLPVPKATFHEAVFNRIKAGTDRYAPVVMPASYYGTDKAGNVVDALHPIDPGEARSKVQDDVWNWIWLRRVVYFLTIFATLFIAAIPFWVIYAPGFGRSSVGGFVIPIVNAAASFLPGFLEPWFVAFRNAPGLVLAGVIAVAVLMTVGGNLQQTIRDVARVAWHSPATHGNSLTGWHAFVYWLRRRGIYQATFYTLKHWVFPTAIMFWLFSWLAFGTANTLGLICKATDGVEVGSAVEGSQVSKLAIAPAVMETAKICNATGMKVTQGETYRVTLKLDKPWMDNKTPTDPNGFSNRQASWVQLLGWPYKRLIWSNWFATILRVGGPGLEEHVLPLEKTDGAWSATFEPRSSGEVFLYVNDSAIGLPWLYDYFYRANNHGTATVELEKLKRTPAPNT